LLLAPDFFAFFTLDFAKARRSFPMTRKIRPKTKGNHATAHQRRQSFAAAVVLDKGEFEVLAQRQSQALSNVHRIDWLLRELALLSFSLYENWNKTNLNCSFSHSLALVKSK